MRMPLCVKPPGIRVALWLVPLLAVACAKRPEHTGHRSLPAHYVEGSFVVSAEATTSEADVNDLSSRVASELGCKAKAPTRVNWGDTADDSAGALSQALLNTYSLSFENCDFSRDGTKAIVNGLASSAGILAAEPEALAAVSPIQENDPDKSLQDYLPLIHRDQACALAERNGKPVVVAVIDTGVTLNHPDLRNMLYRDSNGQIVGANFVGSGAQMPPDDQYDDPNGHGTHVAGLIAAQANNGHGIVGVASCANVKIMPVRVLGTEGSGSSLEIERGVKWAVDHGAQVINLSLGYVTELYDTSNANFSRPLYNAVAAKNVMVFAAAGNDGLTLGQPGEDGGLQYNFPSSYNSVTSVAATNNSGALASFSNRGDRVDVATPGYNVLSTLNNGDYGRMSGTSMASPVAAGSYALALATARAGMDTDRVDVVIAQDMLQKSVVASAHLSPADVRAGGVLDVEKLVKLMAARFPKTPTGPAQPTQPTAPATEPVKPTTPAQPTLTPPPLTPPPLTPPSPADFSFAGLKAGQAAGWPQKLAVQNLPTGTYVVYFYWGNSPWNFSKAYATRGSTTATDDENWYLFGNRQLTAIAISYYGRVLSTTTTTLKGH